MKIIYVTLIISLFSISLQAQNYTGNDKDIASILANIKAFSQHVMNGDAEKIAAAYTEDGKIFPNNRDILEGTDALKKYWAPSKTHKTIHHKVTPEEIKIIGDEAYDFGYYEGKTKRPDGTISSWKGKYVIVWKKVEGEWKIYLDIWNSIPIKE